MATDAKQTTARSKAEAKEAAKVLSQDEKDKIALDYAVASSMEFTPVGSPEPVVLNLATARKFFAKPTRNGVLPSDTLIHEFLMICKSKRLNPWVGDCFLIGYDGDKGASFSIVTAYQALNKRAELHPQYDGIEWGIIVEVDGVVQDREGAFRLEHEKLVGAWAKAYRRDHSRTPSTRLMRSEFGKQFGQWKTMPGWMIGKCARAAALREAFPNELGGMYIAEELGFQDHILPRAIEETERQRKESKPEAKPTVTLGDLTKSPETPVERQLKTAKEFELEIRRLMTVDDVNDARERWLSRTHNEEEFDRINLACDKRIQTLLASQEKVSVGADGELFDHHPNAAEA